MSYAISAPVSGYFSAQARAKVIAQNAIGSILVLLTRAMTPKADVYVFVGVARHDAVITARDNDRNEIAKLMALQAAALQAAALQATA